jgi:hypothetical protein
MITNNKEFYSSPYYFFLKETKDKYSLYISIEETLTEARKKDEMVMVPKDKIEHVKKYLEKIVKDKKKKTTKKVKGEIEELVNADGGMSNSKIPILDPRLHPKKTMDQTISMARITNDPITRGYRTYFGESEMTENDMSDAFGFDETKDLDGKETFKFFVNNLDMEPDEAKDRTEQQGKDPSGKRDEKSKYRYKRVKTKNGKIKKVKDPNFISRQILPEIQKQKAIKVLEDILMNKTSDDKEVGKKELNSSKILTKNVSALKKQAEKEGISLSELIKMLKGE